MNCFEYLICYPDENSFHNDELGNKAFHELEIFNNCFLKGSNSYNEELKNNERARCFINNKKIADNIESDCTVSSHLYIDHYYQDDNFLYKFTKCVENNNHIIDYSVTLGLTKQEKCNIIFTLPLIIDEKSKPIYKDSLTFNENTNEYLLNSESCFKQNYLNVARKIFPNFHDIRLKAIKLKEYIKKYPIKYIQVGNDLVFKKFYEKDNYNRYIKERKSYTKFTIINANGEFIDINTVKLNKILYYIRNNIAHNIGNYDFMFPHKATYDYNGMFFITNWLEPIENRNAIIMPSELFEVLAKISISNYNMEENSYNSLFSPNIDKVLTTLDEWEKYLNRCMKIQCNNVANIDRYKLNNAIDHYLEHYNENEPLDKYLEENLNKLFKNIEIKTSKLKNINLLLHKISNNNLFYFKHIKDLKIYQRETINYLIKCLYNFSITKTNAIERNGKLSEIEINEKHLISILENIFEIINDLTNNKYNNSNLILLKDEVYIAFCTFLIFSNLIYNGFNEDLNGEYSKLNEKEKRDLEKKLDIEMFKGFTFINRYKKGHNIHNKVKTLEDMKNTIKKLRDNIAHFSVKVRFSKNGNPLDNIFFFGYENSDNIYYMISCKDLIDFLNNPLFSEYKSKKDGTLILEDYDELYDIIKEKIKQN